MHSDASPCAALATPRLVGCRHPVPQFAHLSSIFEIFGLPSCRCYWSRMPTGRVTVSPTQAGRDSAMGIIFPVQAVQASLLRHTGRAHAASVSQMWRARRRASAQVYATCRDFGRSGFSRILLTLAITAPSVCVMGVPNITPWQGFIRDAACRPCAGAALSSPRTGPGA